MLLLHLSQATAPQPPAPPRETGPAGLPDHAQETRLDLRPIPPPAPIPEPATPVWPWLIPAGLLTFLLLAGLYRWVRKPTSVIKTPRQQLEEALQLPVEQLTPIDLDHLLRAYLASRSNPLWLSTPQLEAENLWQELLPVSDSAHSWHMRFCTLEERKYTQNTAQNTDVQLYLQAIRELLLTLDDHDKLMKQKNF